jgi:uncharacterized protein YndB with AHSA1/START domain
MKPTDFDPGPLAEVHARAEAGGWKLEFIRDLKHPPAKVWSVLTDPDQLREWAPYTADRNLGSVGEATLTPIDGDGAEAVPAIVRRVEAPTLLEYTWGGSVLRWELAATDSGTRLTLCQTLESEEWVPRVAAGWHLCLLVADHLLDGQPIGPIRGENARNFGWEDLNEAYAAELGVASAGWPL